MTESSSPVLAKIEAAIQVCADRRVLKVLNRAWWREYVQMQLKEEHSYAKEEV